MSEGNVTVYVKENEGVERALKRFKKKFDRIKILRKLRAKTHYKKPSTVRREKRTRAIYRRKMTAHQR